MKNETFKLYLTSLTAMDNTEYWLWQTIKHTKSPYIQILLQIRLGIKWVGLYFILMVRLADAIQSHGGIL